MIVLLAACSGPEAEPAETAAPPEDTALPSPTCPEAGEAVVLGTLSDPQLGEVSGVVESLDNPGVLWVHNDSGDEPQLYALSTEGVLRSTWLLTGAQRGDWEDLALGADEDGSGLLYIGDIGDNAKARSSINIYRVPEPEVVTTEGIQGLAWDMMTLTYPDTPMNAETLLLDPQTDDLYIVTKDYGGATGIFRKAAPHAGGESAVLERVAELDFSAAPLAGGATTAGAISADGRYIVVRTYGTRAFIWLRSADMSIGEAFAGEPCEIILPSEQQGEAIGFSQDGRALWSISEGGGQPVHSVPLVWAEE
ncbi:MAG: hypothetical protein P8R54_33900 [Myxococcota bacterium]|nr:hypothetical protein [Myxococcota bacterium]